ncbi:hypothetical protein V2J09_012600 [Rumex salicifolius]
MEVSSSLGSRGRDEQEFTLKEWNLKGRLTKENHTMSRRFSGSYIRSFREESNRSFRSGYVWECLSPEGFALNSKWHEAERYICNPHSGQFPMECLSSKSFSGRSLHSVIASKITMSAPLVYSRRFNNCPKPPISANEEKDQKSKTKSQLPLQEEEIKEEFKTKDMEIQSTPPDQSQCSISYTSSPLPPNKEESSNSCEPNDEKLATSRLNSMEEVKAMKATKEEEKEEDKNKNRVQEQLNKKQNSSDKLCRCYWQSGCLLSWRCLWFRDRHKKE